MAPGSTREARIVTAVDGSNAGLDALALGRTLAESTGATLVVADVFPYNALFGPTVTLAPTVEACLMRAAEQRLRRIEEALAGFDRWAHHMRAAIPAGSAVLALAEEQGAQMIVVGSSYRRGIGRVSPGTTAQQLLRDARIPVALAPAGWRHRGPGRIRTIGAGFDGSAGGVGGISAAAALAGAMGVALRAVAPARLRSELWQRLDEVVATLPTVVDVEIDLVDGDLLDALSRASAVVGMVVVGPARGPAASALVWRSRSPLLVVPDGPDDPLESVATPLTATRQAAHTASIAPRESPSAV